MKVLVVFFGFLALVWGQTPVVSPCIQHGTAEDLPLYTYVVGCEGPSCAIPQLETLELHIVMKSPREIRSMTTRAYAFLIGPIFVNYDLGEKARTCSHITNTNCPLQKDEVVMYNLRMFIEDFILVGMRVTMELVITDDADGSTIMCLRLPILITSPLSISSTANSTSTA